MADTGMTDTKHLGAAPAAGFGGHVRELLTRDREELLGRIAELESEASGWEDQARGNREQAEKLKGAVAELDATLQLAQEVPANADERNTSPAQAARDTLAEAAKNTPEDTPEKDALKSVSAEKPPAAKSAAKNSRQAKAKAQPKDGDKK